MLLVLGCLQELMTDAWFVRDQVVIVVFKYFFKFLFLFGHVPALHAERNFGKEVLYLYLEVAKMR